ncbi:hypothetical protein [Clostridium perfringens]|uniref:hypothetical protein n=1 Tax=Clostridium perfringens TaxID=1502 RepID=UPI002245236A|nr:hypothetical protein [Clostridium perfringens]MCX0367872.1 hypothetical protein [Clostridium perfringens]
MYKGFNFKTRKSFDGYYESGIKLYNKFNTETRKTIDKYVGTNGEINGSNLQEDWFPNIEADIFLSHSHKDEGLAIRLAGFLYQEYNLVTFIDSCIWGYSNDLLKQIDNKYCWQPKSETYNYTQRNFSTSHVHMMLSTALIKMIDKCECIFFLNTENSVTKTEDLIKNTKTQKTYSPWIYSEINCINLIRKTPISQERKNKFTHKKIILKEQFSNNVPISYNIDYELTNLPILNDNILDIWKQKNQSTKSKKTDCLDNLYLLYTK